MGAALVRVGVHYCALPVSVSRRAREGRHQHLTGDHASVAALVDVLLWPARHD